MDQLYLDVSYEMDEELDFPYYPMDIVINGQRLIDLAREVELPFEDTAFILSFRKPSIRVAFLFWALFQRGSRDKMNRLHIEMRME